MRVLNDFYCSIASENDLGEMYKLRPCGGFRKRIQPDERTARRLLPAAAKDWRHWKA